MSRARTLADQFNSDGDLALTPVASVNAGQIGGRRNLIINGAMQVAQRGTSYSQSPNSGNYHTVDRFSYRRTGGWVGVTAVTLTQESSGAPSGFTHFLRYAPSGADSSVPSDTSMYVDAKLEGNSTSFLGLGTSSAKTFTLSFYVRSSVTGTFSVSAGDNGGASGAKYLAEYTINSANTWERKEITIPGTSSGSFATNTNTGLVILFVVSADASSSTYASSTLNSWQTSTDARWSTNQSAAVTATAGQTWDLTGIQLEIGSQASDFEHRSFGEELALCQRYYEIARVYLESYSDTAGRDLANGVKFAVDKRSAPTITRLNLAASNIASHQTSGSLGVYGAFTRNRSGGSGGVYFDDQLDADAEL